MVFENQVITVNNEVLQVLSIPEKEEDVNKKEWGGIERVKKGHTQQRKDPITTHAKRPGTSDLHKDFETPHCQAYEVKSHQWSKALQKHHLFKR